MECGVLITKCEVYDVCYLAPFLNREVRYVEVPLPLRPCPLDSDQAHFAAGSPPSYTYFPPSPCP